MHLHWTRRVPKSTSRPRRKPARPHGGRTFAIEGESRQGAGSEPLGQGSPKLGPQQFSQGPRETNFGNWICMYFWHSTQTEPLNLSSSRGSRPQPTADSENLRLSCTWWLGVGTACRLPTASKSRPCARRCSPSSPGCPASEWCAGGVTCSIQGWMSPSVHACASACARSENHHWSLVPLFRGRAGSAGVGEG